MTKSICLLLVLSLNSFIFASAGISRALEIDAQNPKSFSDLGVLIGIIWFSIVGMIVLVSYIKNKFK